MRSSKNLAKIVGLIGMLAFMTGSTAQGGGNHGYKNPVYLVPATPVVAYGPPAVAYGPTPLAYAQPSHHLFKPRLYAYPVAAYAAPTTYPNQAGYGPAPTGYGPAAMTTSAVNYVGYGPPAQTAGTGYGPSATVSTYQWQLVKTSNTNTNTNAAGYGPSSDSGVTPLPDLNVDQNAKVRALLREHLASLASKTQLSKEAKESDMIEYAKGYYADQLPASNGGLTSAQAENAKKLALAILYNSSDSSSQSGDSGSGSGNSSGGNNSSQVMMVPAYGPPAYQLYLPVAPGGLFHHKYK
jgi:hypothetical protein